MERFCKNCTFWVPTIFDYGKCDKILRTVDVDITYGWDGGYINCMETPKDFGCNLFEDKVECD